MRKRTFILALAFVLGGCAGGSGPSPAEARNEIVIRTLLSVWESGDTDALLELFQPDAAYDDFPNQVQYHGIDEIVGYVSSVHTWGTAVAMNVIQVHATEDGATAEWVLSAIQEGPIGDMVPVATGREVVLNGVTLIETEGGRIRRAADYMDVLPFVLQLGGEVTMPGGGVIRLDLPPEP